MIQYNQIGITFGTYLGRFHKHLSYGLPSRRMNKCQTPVQNILSSINSLPIFWFQQDGEKVCLQHVK